MSPYILDLIEGIRRILMIISTLSVIAVLLMFLVSAFGIVFKNREQSPCTRGAGRKVFRTSLIIFLVSAFLAVIIPKKSTLEDYISETTELCQD